MFRVERGMLRNSGELLMLKDSFFLIRRGNYDVNEEFRIVY